MQLLRGEFTRWFKSALSDHGCRSKLYLIASQYVDVSTLHLSLTMTGQSLVKHILTEGDKIILSWWSSLQNQGGYAIAVNYGALFQELGCYRS
jgi:hypothetical protein